jgi:hypothetical protein
MAIVTISDRKWELLEAHFIDYYGDTQGRSPKWPLREILKAIIWILHTTTIMSRIGFSQSRDTILSTKVLP